MIKLIAGLIILFRKFSKDEMPVFAASATFWMLISVVPFIMVVMTAVQFVPGLDKHSVENIVFSAAPDLPQIRELIQSVVDNLYIAAPSAVISLTAVMALWSASAGVYAVENGIMKIYGTAEGLSYPKKRLRALWFTFLFLLLLLLTLVLLVFGSFLQTLLVKYLPLFAPVGALLLRLRVFLLPAILFLAFLFVYAVMPGVSCGVRNHCPGAAFATAGWIVFSYLFSIYFTYIRNISYMYGSLGAIVLVMFWMFVVFCLLFFGAEINAFCGGSLKEQNRTEAD